MARIFVSHSSVDQAIARDIMDWLRSLGFDNAFLDIDERTGIRPGDKWEARLYEELAACSAVVLVVTPNWLASKWCFAEFVQARATGKAIFPIIFTPDGGQTFAGDLQRVDFSTDPEGGRRSLAQRLKDLALDVQSGFDWDARRAPYPGLPAFEREDAAVYFGRDLEVRELIDRLRARRAMGGAHMLAVLGASGSGKSSLLRAGVLPRLQKFEPGFVVVPPLRPGADPCAELAKALAEALGQPTQWRTLLEHLQAEPGAVASDLLMAAGRREATLLITIDQAEELFSATPAEARARFADWLRALHKQPVLLLLTLRSDHLGELQQWAQGIGAFEQFSLPPLPPARLAQVIEGPARVAGSSIAPGVVDAVMHDAGGADAMPLLAFTLRELWARATADAGSDAPVIRLADYQSLADAAAGLNPLENAVRRRADELVAPLDDAARQALREAFVVALVRIDDQGVYGRRAALRDELDPAVQPTLDAFVSARLLVARSDESGRRSVEVAHESLLRKWPLLRDWLDDERGFLIGRLQLQRALDDWQAAAPAQRDSALLQGLMLARARAWAAERPKALSAAQRDFIAASVAREQAQRRAARRRWIAIGSAGVAALALIVGLSVYLRQQQLVSAVLAVEVEADRWLQRASAALAYGQSDRALAQAAQAYRLSPSAKTRSALWQAGVSLPPQWRFSVPPVDAQGELPASTIGSVSALAWSADMQQLLIGDRTGALHQLPLQGERRSAAVAADRERPPSKDLPEAVLALQTLADGTRLAVLEDGRVLRQPAGAERYAVLAQGEPLAAAAIGGDGRGVLVLTQAERLLRWLDCSARCAADPVFDGLGELEAMALEPGSGMIAAADAAGHLLIGRAGEAPRRIAVALPEGARIQALAFDGRSGRVALGTSGGELWLLGADGQLQARLPSFGAALRRLAWAPGGEYLVADCEAASLCVWRRDGGGLTLHSVLAVRGAAAGALAWSPDGQRLAGGDLGGRVQVWDVTAAPTRAAVLRSAVPAPLADVAVHADGVRIAAADVRGRLRLWDLPSQRVLLQLAHRLPGEARGLRFHPQLPQLAFGTLGGGVEVFALDGGASLGQIEGSIDAVAWDVQGRLLTGGQDGVVRSHQLGTGQSTALPEAHSDAVVALAVAPEAPAAAGQAPAVYSADTRGVVKVHGAERGTVATATDAAGKPFSVDSLAFAPDGTRWLAAGAAGDVLVFDRATRQLRQRLETGADQVHAAAFSPDGRFVAAIDNAGRLQVWQGEALQRYATLWLRNEPGRAGSDAFGVLGPLRRLAWLPDSKRVAIATQSGVVLVIAVPVEDWLAPPPSR
ncbi:MAG TPA: TIR domain-containing protein [Rubrivivax sp.]|nr:TIR domain-containing protein [Rubrivivax sp.]